jgi:hypothetical protein
MHKQKVNESNNRMMNNLVFLFFLFSFISFFFKKNGPFKPSPNIEVYLFMLSKKKKKNNTTIWNQWF